VADPSHVVTWATEASTRCAEEPGTTHVHWPARNPKRGRGRPRTDARPRPGSEPAAARKGARFAPWKNPQEDLTDDHKIKLAWIAATDPRLYRAYLLN